jgi:hypothetical protein
VNNIELRIEGVEQELERVRNEIESLEAYEWDLHMELDSFRIEQSK